MFELDEQETQYIIYIIYYVAYVAHIIQVVDALKNSTNINEMKQQYKQMDFLGSALSNVGANERIEWTQKLASNPIDTTLS